MLSQRWFGYMTLSPTFGHPDVEDVHGFLMLISVPQGVSFFLAPFGHHDRVCGVVDVGKVGLTGLGGLNCLFELLAESEDCIVWVVNWSNTASRSFVQRCSLSWIIFFQFESFI